MGRKRPYWRTSTAFLLLLGLLFSLSAQNLVERNTQRVQFKNIRLQNNQVENEIHGFRITYDLYFDYSVKQFKNEVPKDGISYRILAYLNESSGLRVPAVPDARELRADDGYVFGKGFSPLKDDQKVLPNQSIFIPWYALALPKGTNYLKVRLEARDPNHEVVLGQGTSDVVQLDKPAALQMRILMYEFEVNRYDYNNENWDYYFINPAEANPDPKWVVIRGNTEVHSSERQKNTYIYSGGPNDHTGYFTLSQDDQVHLFVREFDVTTLSDKVGELIINPFKPDYPFGKRQNVTFDKVDRMDFLVEQLGNTSARLGAIKIEPDVTFEGMSGIFLITNYELERAEASQQFLGKLYLQDENRPPIPHVYPVNGNAQHDKNGEFKLTGGAEGTLKIFVPHHVLSQLPAEGGSIIIRIETEIQGQRFLAAHTKAKAEPRKTYIHDLTFPSIKIQPNLVEGISGITIDFRYQLPAGYFDRLVDASYSMDPEFLVDLLPLSTGMARLVKGEGVSFSNGKLDLEYGKTEGGGQFFVPFHSLAKPAGQYPVTARFTSNMALGGKVTVIGKDEKSQRIEFPELDSIRIYFSELKTKGAAESSRKISWRVSLGTRVLYTSVSGKGRNRLFWDADQVGTVRGSVNDRVKIELVNAGVLNDDLIESWEFSLSELRAMRGEKLKLKSFRVRKLAGMVF
ncbi:MAG: hypothetical protein H6581_27025 [Bacteroidia bacterium]|nr:hypothetical protein [Bacteroidia bacterium]